MGGSWDVREETPVEGVGSEVETRVGKRAKGKREKSQRRRTDERTRTERRALARKPDGRILTELLQQGKDRSTSKQDRGLFTANPTNQPSDRVSRAFLSLLPSRLTGQIEVLREIRENPLDLSNLPLADGVLEGDGDGEEAGPDGLH